MIEGKDDGFVDYLYNGEYSYLIPFDFKLYEDVAVELRLGNVVLSLALDEDYIITETDGNYFVLLNADAEYAFAPEVLGLSRDMELTQPYSFDSGESVVRRYLEDALDRLILLIQAMTRGISGALFFPTNEDVVSYLPSSTERGGHYLGFDDDGEMEVWVDGYDTATAAEIHEAAIAAEDATEHNTHYGTNDQEQFLPSQEGQIKGSFLMTLDEDTTGRYGYMDAAVPGIDYYAAAANNRMLEIKDSLDPRYNAQITESMMFFLIPGSIPAGLDYDVIDDYVGYYAFHDSGYVDSVGTVGSSTHVGGDSMSGNILWGYGHQPAYGGTGSDRKNAYWLRDDFTQVTEHSHTIPDHTHTDPAPSELDRVNLIPISGLTSLTAGVCCLAPAGEAVPAGFTRITTADERYIKFVDDTETTVLVDAPAHNHGASSSMTSGGDNEAGEVVEIVCSLDPEDLYYGQEPQDDHTHSLLAHVDGEAFIESPAHNYMIIQYTGDDSVYLPNNAMVGSVPGAECFIGTRRIYGYGDYCRSNDVFEATGQAWHDHINEGLISGFNSNSTSGSVRATSTDPSPVYLWPVDEHTHGWSDIHSDQDIYPLGIRLNFFLSVGSQYDDATLPTTPLVTGGGVMGEEYGLSKTDDPSSLMRIVGRGLSNAETFQYSANDYLDIKIFAKDDLAYIIGNPSSSFPGHMIVNTAPLNEAGLTITQRLSTAPYNYANSTYCMNVEDGEIHQLLGSGELRTYDITTWLEVRDLAIPAGTFAAEWSDYYYGIVALMAVDGIYSLVYIRPQEPGIGVYVCDQYEGLTEYPILKTLGKDGGIAVVFDDDTSPLLRLYFDLDKSYDITLEDAGAVQEIAWLKKISTLKVRCANKSYSTIEGIDVKTNRLPVKSFLPYVDKDVVEWTE